MVASGKGGVGVSLVSALLGLAVAGEGWRVLLVDGADSYGRLHLMLGVAPGRPLAAARGGDVAIEAPLTPVAGTLSLVLGGGAEPPDAAPPVTERRPAFRRMADLYHHFDLVVVDAGSRLESVVTACGEGMTHLVMVATEDRIMLAASHALLEAIETRIPGLPVDVVVNRANHHAALHVHADLAEAAERLLGRSPRLAGAIPDDPCVQGGLAGGMTVQDAAVGSPAAVAARLAGVRLMADERELVCPALALALT